MEFSPRQELFRLLGKDDPEEEKDEETPRPNRSIRRRKFKVRRGVTRSLNGAAIERHARARARHAWRTRQRNRKLGATTMGDFLE